MPKPWKFTLIFLCLSPLLVFVAAFSLTDNRLHLVFCDVGQGDAILIYKGSSQVLIDGGPDNRVLTCLSNHMPFWDRKIEVVALTNADADHYTGLIEVVRRYQTESFLSPGVWKQAEGVKTLTDELVQREVKPITAQAGVAVKIADLNFKSYWPTKEYLADVIGRGIGQGIRNTGDKENVLGIFTSQEAINKYSLVLGLSYGNFDALLTGDIQPPATDLLAKDVENSTSGWEVLKVPHHGSKNGLTKELLKVVNPKLAVISVGAKNRYGHPSKETIGLLERWNVRILRTDQNGEIEITTDGKTWSTQ